MFCNRIRIVFLALAVWLGLAVLIQADISVHLTLIQPANTDVFEGDQIKLRCESSSDSKGAKADVTWHYSNYDKLPAISNSSNVTNIVTWNEGNKTTSVLTVNIGAQKHTRPFFIYCTSRTTNDMDYQYQSFRYISASSIPEISVEVPRNETVIEGTRRHYLRCEVSSNVEITELRLTWLFGNQTIAEKLLKNAKKGHHNYLLQCLTEGDLGNYTCIANTTMYGKVWQASGTTFISGTLPENSGMRDKVSLTLYFVMFLLLLWKAT